jgi:alkylation response protein AidB-like acyl-CoA dehydrogenase
MEHAYKGLTSRDPGKFKTSGQWMTERTGGSDVSRSMTFAYAEAAGSSNYILKGHKWFTSAITANMAFTLASTEQQEQGKRAPLSLFYQPVRNADGSLNGIDVEALKDKLGTKALPNAQVVLTGAKARLVGDKGKGVRTISTLFNITRIYNTISAVSYIRRAYALVKAYSVQREAFGKKIGGHLLYQKNLRELEIAYQSNTMLAFFLTRLLGREECGQSTPSEEALLRLLTPVAKLYTAKQSIKWASEHIEMFGGLGYLEDSNIPVMLRNAQVLSIWEGTTNVLSLDMLRAVNNENGLEAFTEFSRQILSATYPNVLAAQREIVDRKVQHLFRFVSGLPSPETMEGSSRDLAFYLAETTIALLWLDFLKDNLNKGAYFNALEYWTAFKMDESSLSGFSLLIPQKEEAPAVK